MNGFRILLISALLGVVAAACGSAALPGDSTVTSAIGSTTTSIVGTSQAPATTIDVSTTSTSVTLAAPEAFIAEALPTGAILIAADHGIVVTTEAGTTVLDVTRLEMVSGDGAGGVLLQQGGAIWWLEVGEPAPRLVVSVESSGVPDGAEIHLESGALINGQPHALYIVLEQVEEVSVAPVVVVHNLVTGADQHLFTDQGGEGGGGDVWFGGGVVSAGYSFEGYSYFQFENLAGETTVPNPQSQDSDFELHVGPSVLSPDGSRFLYLASPDYLGGTAEDEIDLVVFDMTTGTEERRLRLPTGDFYYGRIDFDGRSVLLSRFVLLSQGQGWLPVLEIGDIFQNSENINELAWAGPATFTR